MSGFRGPFLTSVQALPDPQESNNCGHSYGASANDTQETNAQVNTEDLLQALSCAAMKYKEAMENLTNINLTLSQSQNQALEAILVLSKQLQSLHVQPNQKLQPQIEQH